MKRKMGMVLSRKDLIKLLGLDDIDNQANIDLLVVKERLLDDLFGDNYCISFVVNDDGNIGELINKYNDKLKTLGIIDKVS